MSYYKDLDNIPFVKPVQRDVFQGVRHMVKIPGTVAIVNPEDNYTYCTVSDRYQMVHHQEVIDMLETLIKEVPGLQHSNINRQVWTSNNGGRMKVKYTFNDITHEIRANDIVALTLEAFASFDTSLAQRIFLGFYRLICSNGAKIGSIISEYKRKHTASLNLTSARNIIRTGVENYPEAMDQLRSLDRAAMLKEINLIEDLPFQKNEKEFIESEIKRLGRVEAWDDVSPKDRKVAINAWDMYNILTETATHKVPDIVRQQRIIDMVAGAFTA